MGRAIALAPVGGQAACAGKHHLDRRGGPLHTELGGRDVPGHRVDLEPNRAQRHLRGNDSRVLASQTIAACLRAVSIT